jgi:hypothetical protein
VILQAYRATLPKNSISFQLIRLLSSRLGAVLPFFPTVFMEISKAWRKDLSPPLEIWGLRLQPCSCPTAHVARADPLRDNAS